MDEHALNDFRTLMGKDLDYNSPGFEEKLRATAERMGRSETLDEGLRRTKTLDASTAGAFTEWLDTLDPVGQVITMKAARVNGVLTDFIHSWATPWFAKWACTYRSIAFPGEPGDDPPSSENA